MEEDDTEQVKKDKRIRRGGRTRGEKMRRGKGR